MLNFKQDGTQFVNQLSLHPIAGVKGEYQYSLAILLDSASERANNAAGKAEIAKIRSHVPQHVSPDKGGGEAPAPSAPAFVDEGAAKAKAEREALFQTWRTTLVKLTRLVYSLDWKDTLKHLLTIELARKVRERGTATLAPPSSQTFSHP